MDLRELQREWDARGATNPFQASLTDAAGNGIRPNVDEVFALGEEEISGAMGMLQNLGVRLNS